MDVFKNEEPTILSSCQIFEHPFRFVYSQGGLLCQGFDLLWGQGHVVYANVVDQAGPKTSWIKIFTGREQDFQELCLVCS